MKEEKKERQHFLRKLARYVYRFDDDETMLVKMLDTFAWYQPMGIQIDCRPFYEDYLAASMSRKSLFMLVLDNDGSNTLAVDVSVPGARFLKQTLEIAKNKGFGKYHICEPLMELILERNLLIDEKEVLERVIVIDEYIHRFGEIEDELLEHMKPYGMGGRKDDDYINLCSVAMNMLADKDRNEALKEMLILIYNDMHDVMSSYLTVVDAINGIIGLVG